MPYRTHSDSRVVWYGVLVAAAVAALVALIYFLGTHRVGEEPAYEPPKTVQDRSTGHPRHRHHREQPAQPSTTGGPGWFADLPFGPGVAPGPHEAVISVSSGTGDAIGIEYAFRTGEGVRSDRTQTSSSWTASRTVRGGEPLAGVIAQVASGSVSCSVRVDGRVISQKTRSGEYATVSCAG